MKLDSGIKHSDLSTCKHKTAEKNSAEEFISADAQCILQL